MSLQRRPPWPIIKQSLRFVSPGPTVPSMSCPHCRAENPEPASPARGQKGKRTGRTALGGLDPRASGRTPLDEALKYRLLAVVGDPGSGKSTFVNDVAHRQCRILLNKEPVVASAPSGLAGRSFPAIIPLAHLWQHVESARQRANAPTTGNP